MTESEILARCPHIKHVPKNPLANIRYRYAMRTRAQADTGFRRAIMSACKRDMLFWMNVFGTLFEPREARILPFVTWDFQDETMLEAYDCLGKRDMTLHKSRDVGASWMILYLMKWRWLFYGWQSFLLVSRSAQLVDSTEDPDALFWKLDFIFRNLPWWMKPRFNRTEMHFKNLENESTFDGRATTSSSGAGGRRLGVLLDELARVEPVSDQSKILGATQPVTRSRYMVSSPCGAVGAFWKMCTSPKISAKKVTLMWHRNKERARGLYQFKNGDLQILDKTYKFPPGYPFILDGEIRSPWCDDECARCDSPAVAAQEIFAKFIGSNYPFYQAVILDRVQHESCCPPMLIGEVEFDEYQKPIRFSEQSHGRLKLWFQPDPQTGRPPGQWQCSAGADISAGTGGSMTSNTAFSIARNDTGEKVAEWTSQNTLPADAARCFVALMRWFNGAKACWEANGGPGKQFGNAVVLDCGYRNIFYRQREDSLKRDKADMLYGWSASGNSKIALHGSYATALRDAKFVNRSHAAIEECRHYVYTGRTVEHDEAAVEDDPSASGENHGDRVVADALCWKMMADAPRYVADEEKQKVMPGSLAWRRKMHAEQQEEMEEEFA